MSIVEKLDAYLDKIYKNMPKMPAKNQKLLTQLVPWINIILGVITLLTAWSLWEWAHIANDLITTGNSLNAIYGGTAVTPSRLTSGIWLGIIVLVVQAALFLAAFNKTKDHKKSGWQLMFYAGIVNVIYGVVIAFTDYGGLAVLVWSILFTIVGYYFLFQIRSSYS